MHCPRAPVSAMCKKEQPPVPGTASTGGKWECAAWDFGGTTKGPELSASTAPRVQGRAAGEEERARIAQQVLYTSVSLPLDSKSPPRK